MRIFLNLTIETNIHVYFLFCLLLDGEYEAQWLVAAGFPQLTRAYEQVSMSCDIEKKLICIASHGISRLIEEISQDQSSKSIFYLFNIITTFLLLLAGSEPQAGQS